MEAEAHSSAWTADSSATARSVGTAQHRTSDWRDIACSWANVEGTRLHWAELGQGNDGVPVVLIHGLNDSHLAWKKLAPSLAADRRILMPDLPGHGYSARPDASYALQWHARMICAWLEQLDVPQVDVVGHSFGGGVAQMLLLHCPTRIRRLMLVASGGLGREVGWVLRLATIPRVVEHLGQPFMAAGARLALRAERGAFSKQDLDEVIAMTSAAGSARAFARTVRDVICWRGQQRCFFDRAHEVSRLPPMAVYWGDRDTLIPMSHGLTFAAMVDGVRFIRFAGCGHFLHREQPTLLANNLRDFIEDPFVPIPRLRTAPMEARRDEAPVLEGFGKIAAENRFS